MILYARDGFLGSAAQVCAYAGAAIERQKPVLLILRHGAAFLTLEFYKNQACMIRQHYGEVGKAARESGALHLAALRPAAAVHVVIAVVVHDSL